MTKDSDAARKALLKPLVVQQEILRSDYLSTGSTLLNMACTGKPYGGFLKGHYFFIVGDSASGKTFLSLTCFAEAAINRHFDNYRLIFDNVEGGALMSLRKFFGKGVADRLEPPAVDDEGKPVYSATIEDFYFHVDDAQKIGKPFVYVLDSMDALSSLYEKKKFDEKKKASRGGPVAKGDYGDGKAKSNSTMLRKVLSGIHKTGSILILISQTRDNVGGGPFEPSKVRSGGRALKFYCGLELWSSVRGVIKKTVKGKPRKIGVKVKVQVQKNRIQGKDRTIELPIHYSMGIDDLGSCVDFLVEEDHWPATNGMIVADDLDLKGKRETLIRKIEAGGLERDLRELVTDVWNEIEKACEVIRKPRYS